MVSGAAEATSDGELAVAAAGGSADAYATLYERYFDRLHDFAVRIVHDRDLAADVVQAALVRAWTTIRSRGAPEHVKAWLFTVTRNEAIDQLRRRRREAPLTDEGDEDQRAFTVIDESRLAAPDAAMRDGELVGLVWAAARALNPREYALLDMHLRQDLAPEEIAEAMGLKVGAVYTALSRLRDALEEAVATELLVRHGREQCRALAALLIAKAGDAEGQERSVRRAVKKHLKRCDICTEQRRRMTSPAALFGALAPVLAPPAAAFTHWREARGPAATTARTGLPGIPRWFWAGAAATIAAAIVIAFFLFRGDGDVNPPAAPRDPDDVTSTSHDVGSSSSDPVIRVAWTDPGGAAGYSLIWTEDPGAIPDEVADLEGSATGATSPPLDPGDWYFVLRTRGKDGSWTSTVHLGPFTIVRLSPGAPAAGQPTDTPAPTKTPSPTPEAAGAGSQPGGQPGATNTPTATPTRTPTPPTPEPTATDTPTATPAGCVMTNSLDFQGVDVEPGMHTGRFQLRLRDQFDQPVEGATISAHAVKSNGEVTNPVVETNATGNVLYLVQTTAYGPNFLFIDSITHPSCTWDDGNSVTLGQFDAEP